jgi:hypothetical protein
MRSATLPLFGQQLLPTVTLPTLGYVAQARGEWHRYCRGWSGFNAVLPISWELAGVGYS